MPRKIQAWHTEGAGGGQPRWRREKHQTLFEPKAPFVSFSLIARLAFSQALTVVLVTPQRNRPLRGTLNSALEHTVWLFSRHDAPQATELWLLP
jgi:hypothetical protein